ncbi:hypothetical protein [Mycolicibacterium hippocampi]|uniref:hypothetical protein n=1 Tax=Mycolicibacterium hippocampi TaxID=659824 RepID=UPI0035114105
MAAPGVVGRLVAAGLIVFGFGLGGSTTNASADPGETEPPAPGPAAVGVPVEGDPAEPVSAACRQFTAVLRVASVYYNNFAYSIAGNGAYVDYQDPTVRSENLDGRTALRKAAGEALSAASTPGLPPNIANPMRSWSWHAGKLVLAMGLRADGDTLDNRAAELDKEAEITQMACANAGALPTRGPRR